MAEPSTPDPVSTVGFLGPEATFTEAAMRQMPSVGSASTTTPYPTVDAVLDAVRRGDVSAGVVPIENSLEGPVTSTLDALARGDSPLVIVEEWALPVQFSLMVRTGTTLAEIEQVATIPIAAAQCRQWLSQNLPNAGMIAALSTAGAAAKLANEDVSYQAAISPELAAERYGLEILAENIGDNADASTRFVLVQRPRQAPAPTGADKTTLVLFMREDHSGALLEILTEFAVRGVNLTRIESRPTKRQLGDYYFSVDCEGHVQDARVGEALAGLRRVCADVRYLGSYPRHDGKESHVRIGTTDADFDAANAWLANVRRSG